MLNCKHLGNNVQEQWEICKENYDWVNMIKGRARDSVFITYSNSQVFIVALASYKANSKSLVCEQKQMCCVSFSLFSLQHPHQ